ncbi:AbrB/MazE/SpoVT family DNA-binding domain-containing protein [Archaeoglobales archaeon]|nr:MAG: AbrB/MazE/SpoVT family DNA-binding domain-containing protein [Archaeoglobales archaeon]
MNYLVGKKGKVGKKGEIYIPKKIRESVGLMPGDEVEVEIAGDRLMIRKKKTALDLLKGEAVAKIKVEEIREVRDSLSERLST